MADVSFVITNVGLEKAAQANEKGIAITIGKFVLGSGYGYQPSANDQKIRGDFLYEGNPSAYKYMGEKTIRITCTVPQEVGPFQWGEVGLYLDSGELFALLALPEPNQKYSSLESNVPSTLTLYCYLTLSWKDVKVTVDYGENPTAMTEFLDVYSWASVQKPSATPEGIEAIIVHELSPTGDATLLTRASDDWWSVASTYDLAYNGLVPVESTMQYIGFAVSTDTTKVNSLDVTSVSGTWLLQTANCEFYLFQSAVLSPDSSTLRFYYTEPLDTPVIISSRMSLYRAKDPQQVKPTDINNTVGNLPWDRVVGKPDFFGGIPVGAMVPWPVNSTPANYLIANGAAVSRTTYADLFSVYGTRFGAGDGSTTFNLPDYRDYFLVGAGSRLGVGQFANDGLPGASGMHGGHAFKYGNRYNATGPFYGTNSQNGGAGATTNCAVYMMGFDLSRANAIFGAADYVRPKSSGVHWIIRYR